MHHICNCHSFFAGQGMCARGLNNPAICPMPIMLKIIRSQFSNFELPSKQNADRALPR